MAIGVIWGEIWDEAIWNTAIWAQAGSDTAPDAFSFTDQAGVDLSTVTTSNTLALAGTDANADISISGATAEYQVDGGAWTAVSGTIAPGSTFAVRITSSGSYLTAVNAILTIGGINDTFTVTTQGDPANTAYVYSPFGFGWWRF